MGKTTQAGKKITEVVEKTGKIILKREKRQREDEGL